MAVKQYAPITRDILFRYVQEELEETKGRVALYVEYPHTDALRDSRYMVRLLRALLTVVRGPVTSPRSTRGDTLCDS